MEIKLTAGDITQIEADGIVVELFEGVNKLDGATAAADRALGGAISYLISSGEIKGKTGEVSIIHTLGKLPARVVAVAGLGKRQEFNVDRVRIAAGDSCRTLRKLNCHKVATILIGAGVGDIKPETAAEAIVEGSLLGLYNFTRYKKPEYEDIEEILIVERETSKFAALEQSVHKGKIMAEATRLARDMVNEPANCMTPSQMAEATKEIASKHNLGFNVLDSNDIETMGMGALLGVSKGSSEPPKLIVLSYKGDVDSHKTIGFIGKGVTFDSGGISIKPSEGMAEMKDDMAIWLVGLQS